MGKFKLLLLLNICGYACFGQTGATVEVNNTSTTNNYGVVRYTDPSALGGKQAVTINNDEITGNSFWKTNWNRALIIFDNKNAIALQNAKLDFYTNSIYYMDSAKNIKVADTNNINMIVFIDKADSTKTLATFRKINYNDNNAFYQAFNKGTYQLLKLTHVDVRKTGYNTTAGRDEYNYDAKTEYYLFFEGNMKKLDGLNRNSITSLIALSTSDEQWLLSNHNKLKGEEQIVGFIDYYNDK